MNQKGRVIAARIRQELDDLRPLIEKAQRGMRAAKLKSDDQDLYLDSVALNVHDFYCGMERILLHVAGTIDKVIPEGGQWHQELLQQMHTTVAGVRPSVLSSQAVDCLKEYLAFRHVVRNVYSFKFDAERITALVNKLPACYDLVARELSSFADWLESSGT